jgi:hypothetical protein
VWREQCATRVAIHALLGGIDNLLSNNTDTWINEKKTYRLTVGTGICGCCLHRGQKKYSIFVHLFFFFLISHAQRWEIFMTDSFFSLNQHNLEDLFGWTTPLFSFRVNRLHSTLSTRKRLY